MKTYTTLLKVAQGRMDALGLEAARISERIDRLRMESAAASARAISEGGIAASDPLLAPFMPAYQARVKYEIESAATEIAEAEATLGLVRDQLSAAWREKSKFEHLIERARAAQAAGVAALEQAALDEVAINRAGQG